MYHVADNLYFGRCADGTVRVLKFKQTPVHWPVVTQHYSKVELEFDFTVPAGVWPSVVAAVSKQGEANGRYYTAKSFHDNPPVVPNVKKKYTGEPRRKSDEAFTPVHPYKSPPPGSHVQDDCLFHHCPYPDSCKKKQDCMHKHLPSPRGTGT